MKLLLISEDQVLKESFESVKKFDVQNQSTLNLISHVEPNVLIISDHLVDKNELIEKADEFDEIDFVFYMLSGVKRENEIIKPICESKNIYIVPPHLTNGEIVSKILQVIVPKTITSNNVVLFYGADSKVGTTMTTQAIGEYLAEQTDKRVLVISLSNKPNDQYIPKGRKSIDALKTKLASRIIDFDDILEECYKNKHFFLLPGPRDILGIRKYTIEDINYLLELVSAQRDFIILIDAGSDMDNPLTVAAIQKIKNRYLITTPLPSSLENFRQLETQVLSNSVFNLRSDDFLLIINKFKEFEDNEGSKIADSYKATLIGTLPFSNDGKTVEIERQSLKHFDTDYREKLFNITKVIATKADTNLIKDESKKTSFFKRLVSSAN